MFARIIDCQDQDLCFRPREGKHFRCFYVTADQGGLRSRVLVSVQPDRTAQIVQVCETRSGTAAGRSDTWTMLIRTALDNLRQEPVTAAYVLNPESDGICKESLSNSGLRYAGQVVSLSSFDSLEAVKPRTGRVACVIKTRPAEILRSTRMLRDGNSPEFVRQIVSLLDNTIQHSEDCVLRTQLRAEDVLALFAFNPGEMTLLIANVAGVVRGLMVVDASYGPNRGHIEYVGVHADYRRQHVASLLIEEFSRLIDDGPMTVAVHERNLASLSYFRSTGFEATSRYQLWTKDDFGD